MRESGVARPQPIHHHLGVLEFAFAMGVDALAASYAAEIEPHHDRTRSPQPACHTIHHFVVHRPAVKRMRMADETDLAGGTSFRLFEKRFDLPGAAFEQV